VETINFRDNRDVRKNVKEGCGRLEVQRGGGGGDIKGSCGGKERGGVSNADLIPFD